MGTRSDNRVSGIGSKDQIKLSAEVVGYSTDLAETRVGETIDEKSLFVGEGIRRDEMEFVVRPKPLKARKIKVAKNDDFVISVKNIKERIDHIGGKFVGLKWLGWTNVDA